MVCGRFRKRAFENSKHTGSGVTNVYLTRRFSQIILNAQDEAKAFKDDYTSVEHIYIALLKERNTPSQSSLKDMA